MDAQASLPLDPGQGPSIIPPDQTVRFLRLVACCEDVGVALFRLKNPKSRCTVRYAKHERAGIRGRRIRWYKCNGCGAESFTTLGHRYRCSTWKQIDALVEAHGLAGWATLAQSLTGGVPTPTGTVPSR